MYVLNLVVIKPLTKDQKFYVMNNHIKDLHIPVIILWLNNQDLACTDHIVTAIKAVDLVVFMHFLC